jgi:tRNA(Leu) C34 or U34 (ribose-2'-O)-methylase TrmL
MRASGPVSTRLGSMKVTIPDAYNVVRLLVRLGSTFDDIAALGFYAGSRKLTGSALEVWYLAEKEERKPIAEVVLPAKTRKRTKV